MAAHAPARRDRRSASGRRLAVGGLGLCLLALLYWWLVGRLGGVAEPWDARFYWNLAYPAALLGAGVAGWRVGRQGWLAGPIIMVMQLPVMWLAAESPVNLARALFFITLLSMPAAASSWLAGRLADRAPRTGQG
jgi:hypothetical protein